MNANEVYRVIQELSAKHGGAPVSVENLIAQLKMSRAEVFSYLVDLSLAGLIDLSRNIVTPLKTYIKN